MSDHRLARGLANIHIRLKLNKVAESHIAFAINGEEY
jgi:hypothetical protein